MKKIFNIEGMHCKSCVMLVEDELNDLDGIKSARVSIGKAEVEYDGKKISADTIKKSITKLNYKVV